MLEALQAKNIDSEIITNGSVMSDAVCDKLLDLPTDICFSIDGATASVFEGIRVASSFDRVVANIRKLTSRRRVKTKALVARTVVTKDNASQLADIVRLVSDLGLDRLTFQLVLCGWGKNDIEALNAPKRVEDLPQLQSYIDLARAEADKRRLPVYFQSEERYSRTRKCAWPWRSAYIASNGDVVPCCILADSDTAKMGNVFVDDFATIWNSQAYQDLRRGIRDHQLPNYCKGCYADA
jgi:radical SAM protein with 4Fe4S-binding SPASM domain